MNADNESKSDKILHAERMVDELLQSSSAAAIARGSGVNGITVGKIAKGDSSRISDRVYESIRNYYERRQSGTVEVTPRKRKQRTVKAKAAPVVKNAPSATENGDLVNITTIQFEISKTEKRLEILKQMLELAKEL